VVRFLLDTNAIAEPAKPLPSHHFLERFRKHDGEMAVSAIAWHEAWFGIERLPRGKRRHALGEYLNEVIGRSMPILPYDEAAATWHAKERARLAAVGRAPSLADGQIAAIAATNGLMLVTANTKHFAPFEHLKTADWTRAP
jgi:tRNA(fMet)-specific endonuclease VapC